MRTERTIVTAVLGGFCALGALSSIIPAVADFLLGLLALAAVVAAVAFLLAWHANRVQTLEPMRRLPTRADTVPTAPARREVA